MTTPQLSSCSSKNIYLGHKDTKLKKSVCLVDFFHSFLPVQVGLRSAEGRPRASRGSEKFTDLQSAEGK